jgi:hypothetical protein
MTAISSDVLRTAPTSPSLAHRLVLDFLANRKGWQPTD